MIPIYITVIVALTGLLVGAKLILSEKLPRFTRGLLLIIIVIGILLGVMEVFSHNWAFDSRLIQHIFDLKTEYTPGALLASTQLVLIGLAAIIQGWRAQNLDRSQRLFWLVFGIGFLFLGIDEFYSIHESLWPTQLRLWRTLYTFLGAGAAVVMAIVWWFKFRNERLLFKLLALGAAMMATGGLTLERLMYNVYDANKTSETYYQVFQLQSFEETLETFGATIILAAVLIYGRRRLSEASWRFLKYTIIAGALLWCALTISDIYLLPAMRSDSAIPVQVEYDDGIMRLLSYQLSADSFIPGDTLRLDLYWRASVELRRNYSLSVHLLSLPEIESVASDEQFFLGRYRTVGWIPGVVVPKTLYIDIPDTLDTPGSYWLALRVWSGNVELGWENTRGLLVTDTDRRLLNPDMLVLTSIPILPDDSPPVPQTSAEYRFSEGFSLSGYNLPTDTVARGDLSLDFLWETNNAVDSQLVQFVHLLQVDGDEFAVFDQELFGGRFPTQDWPSGMAVMDEWTITLPDDLPPGEYNVYMGMYDPVTVERMPVTAADGQAVQDSSIYLGTVIVGAQSN